MDRDEALEELPPPYALALRLRDRGVEVDLIGESLGIDALAVPALLALATTKLEALLRRPGARADGSHRAGPAGADREQEQEALR